VGVGGGVDGTGVAVAVGAAVSVGSGSVEHPATSKQNVSKTTYLDSVFIVFILSPRYVVQSVTLEQYTTLSGELLDRETLSTRRV
jgi:hypothetical protein